MKKISLLHPALGLLLSIISISSYGQAGKPIVRGGQIGFIQNKGQIRDQSGKKNAAVKFLLPIGAGMNVQLRNDGFSYDTYRRTDSNAAANPGRLLHADATNKRQANYAFHRVDISFIGANPTPQLQVQDTLPFYYTFTGSGSQSLRAGVYGKIIYKNIYPSIDLVFERRTSDDSLTGVEYQFVVHPGGDPAVIQWKYAGGKHTAIRQGHITIGLEKGELQEHIPLSYTDSIARPVTVQYRQTAADTYSFTVPSYDRKRTLVIDPTPDLLWGTYYGGESYEQYYGIARNSSGNVIITGQSYSFNGIATSGAYQTTLAGIGDVVIIAFTRSGSLLWATYYGGEANDNAQSIAIDKDDNIFVGGYADSRTGIATPGAFKTTMTGNTNNGNAFLAKFDPGGRLQWGTYYGGENYDQCNAVALDKENNIVIAGVTSSTIGIASTGSWQSAPGGGFDVFVAKFDQTGSCLWGTYYGKDGGDEADGMAVGPDNTIVLTGSSGSSSGMTTPGTFQPAIGGQFNTFVSAFSAAGTLMWGTYYGAGNPNLSNGGGYCVTTDQLGNIYVAGWTICNTNISTTGAMQGSFAGGLEDGFIAKLNKNGGQVWGTYCGGATTDQVHGITTDGDKVWVTGVLSKQSPVVTPGSYQPAITDVGVDGGTFVVQLTSDGALEWGTYYGISTQVGGSSGTGEGIVYDEAKNVYITGFTSADKNIATCGAVQPQTVDDYDGFIAKFGKQDPADAPQVTITADHTGVICKGSPVTFTATEQNAGTVFSLTWMLNGQTITSGVATLNLNQPADGDIVECTMDVSSPCLTGQYPSNKLSLAVDPGTSPSILISTPATTVCPSTAVPFTAVTMDAGPSPSYQWYVNGNAAGTNGPNWTSSDLVDGDMVSCLVTKQGNCSLVPTAPSNKITMSVLSAPIIGLSVSASADLICFGTPVTFMAIPYGGGSYSYQWQVNGITAGRDSIGYTSSSLNNNDRIECLLTLQNEACDFAPAVSNVLQETVRPVPAIVITGDTLIFKGSVSQLDAVSSDPGLSYAWTPSATLSNVFIANPVASPLETTRYTVTVTNGDQCSVQKSITVGVLTRIAVPSAFTPNGDGNNDLFRVKYGSDISDVHLHVYNRWGQLLYSDEGTHRGWDGWANGSRQPAGTYVWVLQYKDIAGKSQVLKGIVELVW